MTRCAKCDELFQLLLEARDALPGITLTAARLHGIDLTLADRIEKAIEPWRLPDCTECKDFAPCTTHRTDEASHPAVWLRKEGELAVVLIEIGGLWVEAIRENLSGEFSHIVEADGIGARSASVYHPSTTQPYERHEGFLSDCAKCAPPSENTGKQA